MAKKAGKHVENARKKVEARPYKLADAAELLKKTHHTKFNETVELAINLGVDPKHSDQVVRGDGGIAERTGQNGSRAGDCGRR
jgi:large subunit ribosomal protein L1